MRKDIVLTGIVFASIGVCFFIGGVLLRTTGDIYDSMYNAQGSQNAMLIGISALCIGVIIAVIGRLLKMNSYPRL
jgi:hypothetical protein